MHAHGVVGRLDVPVSDDGNLERGHDRGDLIPARGATVHLRPRARMQRQRLGAGVLAAESDGHRIPLLFVPAAPDLDGDREMGVGAHCTDDRLDEIEVFEAAGPTIALDDLLYGAAEIDVDEVGREDFRDGRRRLAHGQGFGAKDLHADRVFIGVKAQLRDRRLVLTSDPFGRQELGDDDVGPPRAAESAKRRLRHPCHGRQEQRDPRAQGVRKGHHVST